MNLTVACLALPPPAFASFSDTAARSPGYGDRIRCPLTLNHTHRQDATHRASFFKIEGTAGAAVATLGVNLDYPTGPPDSLEVALDGRAWDKVPLRGSWFTEAFEGPMSNLQRFAAGEDPTLVGAVDDAITTMALVGVLPFGEDGSTPISAT